MDILYSDSLSRNVQFNCLTFMPEISNRMVFVNGKHPVSLGIRAHLWYGTIFLFLEQITPSWRHISVRIRARVGALAWMLSRWVIKRWELRDSVADFSQRWQGIRQGIRTRGTYHLHGKTGNSSWKIKWFAPFRVGSFRKNGLWFGLMLFFCSYKSL